MRRQYYIKIRLYFTKLRSQIINIRSQKIHSNHAQHTGTLHLILNESNYITSRNNLYVMRLVNYVKVNTAFASHVQ